MASAAAGVTIVCSSGRQLQQVAAPPVLRRRSANYQPNSWDYDSICSLQQQEGDDASGHGDIMPNKQNSLQTTLKDRVRQLLKEEDLPTRLRIIDQLQSLGVAYHFEEEIKSILMCVHVEGAHHQLEDDLSSTALVFRMLRGHGLPASTDVFSAFRDDKGGFKAANPKDIDGFIALYEASYLAFPGEAMLDRARAFAIEKLKELMPSLGPSQRERIGGVLLDLPMHWRAPRLQAIWSLKEKEHCNNGGGDDESCWIDPSVLQLARVDFNLVQAVHRGELVKITKWWKETGLGEKLPFARDRLVECFFCATCIAPDPHLAGCREVLGKVGSLIVHLDDIYDVYGTLDELAAFTDAIGRCDDVLAAEAALPEYMKAMYSAIWTTSVTAADQVLKDQGYDVLPLYRNAWHDLCKAFLVETKWQYQSYRPSFDEYLDNGWITSTGPLLLLHAFPMLKQNGLNETQQQIITDTSFGSSSNDSNSNMGYPRLVELSSRIFRLCNDCATHKAESERGDAPSSIACCMMDKCASEEEARDAMGDAIAETWKELNKELASTGGGGGWNPCSAESMANVCLNLARIIHCIYHDGDGITSPSDNRKQLVRDLLFSPVLQYMPPEQPTFQA